MRRGVDVIHVPISGAGLVGDSSVVLDMCSESSLVSTRSRAMFDKMSGNEHSRNV